MKRCAVRDRGTRQGVGERCRRDIAVGRNGERANGRTRQRRLCRARLSSVQPAQLFTPTESRGQSGQALRRARVQRDLQAAGPAVLDVDPGLGANGFDPRVVEVQAPRRQLEEGPSFVRFDVGGQDAS
jgi:hypothetical protein